MDDWKHPEWLREITGFVDKGDLKKASELFTEELAENNIKAASMPEKGFIMVASARLLKRMLQVKRAEKLYKQLLELCPNNIAVLNETAAILQEQGKINEAVKYLTKAIEIDPHDPRLWTNLVRFSQTEKGVRLSEYTVEKTTNDNKIAGSSKVHTTNCWCGGQLNGSVHPAYGRCKQCGTFVLRQQFNNDELEQFYTFEKYWHTQAVQVKNLPPIEQRVISDFNDRIPIWFHLLRQLVLKYKPVPNLLLEIGCAHGGFLAYCRKHGLENVVGNEPDETTCHFAKKHFNLPYIVSGLFPDISLPFEKFGAIVGFDVVEHFREPVRALKKVEMLLSNQGIFLFQIPCYREEGAEWPAFKPPEHIFLYDSENIRKLFNSAGLEIAQIIPGCFKHDMLVMGGKKDCLSAIK